MTNISKMMLVMVMVMMVSNGNGVTDDTGCTGNVCNKRNA